MTLSFKILHAHCMESNSEGYIRKTSFMLILFICSPSLFLFVAAPNSTLQPTKTITDFSQTNYMFPQLLFQQVI